MKMIFSGMQILVNNQWISDHALLVEDDVIQTIAHERDLSPSPSALHYHFDHHHYLIPGLIDLHIHGTHGHDVMEAGEGIATIAQHLAAEGITGFLPTTMTASPDELRAVIANISRMMGKNSGATILGLHLEGPFISPQKAGAQPLLYRKPDTALIREWQTIAGGAIKLMTLAPELAGATELLGELSALNIVPSLGHSNATYEEAMQGVASGIKHGTHLFNAMRGLHHREPGAVGCLLLSPQVSVEVIADGIHLHPAILRLALQMKGASQLVLVTDAISPKCLPEGKHLTGKQWVSIKKGVAKLADGTLAGSTLAMLTAIKNMQRFTGCTLSEAIMMASENPARLLNLFTKKGSIAPGKDADLVLLDKNLQVLLTFCQGKCVYRAKQGAFVPPG